jgi:hypothetical protein
VVNGREVSMKTDLMLMSLILAAGLVSTAQAGPGELSREWLMQEPTQEKDNPGSTPPAQPEEGAPPADSEEPGPTTAGASVSSTGTGVGVTTRRDRFFYGGGLGLGFGDIKFVEVWPLFGYNFTPKVRGGITLIFRYRKDDRFPDSTSTTDYGGSLFVDYFPLPKFFIRGEFEYLNYEFYTFDSSGQVSSATEREGYTSVFGGVGFANPIGPNGALNIMLLYNFTHDEVRSPYADPYVIRIGVSFGF